MEINPAISIYKPDNQYENGYDCHKRCFIKYDKYYNHDLVLDDKILDKLKSILKIKRMELNINNNLNLYEDIEEFYNKFIKFKNHFDNDISNLNNKNDFKIEAIDVWLITVILIKC